MESLENLMERVDRLTALVETAVTQHASAAAEAVARGVQTYAISWIGVWVLSLIILGGLIWIGARMFIAGEVKEGRDMFGRKTEEPDGAIVTGAGTFIICSIAVVVVTVVGLAKAPTIILEATDPIAAIARDVALGR